MKLNLRILTLVGLALGSLASFAQTNASADGLPAASPPATNEVVQTEPAQPAPPPAESADPAAPAVEPATTTAAAVTPENCPPQGAALAGAIIPLIVMDDVPLTDAIKNLTRQAGLNYMLDPKVSFGQPGADGRTAPQPVVSIRWENVTASQALTALLNNYNLQLIEDPKSRIARISVKDPAAPDPLVTKVIQLQYANPTNIMVAVQNTLTDKRSKVVGDIRTSQLVVLATEKELADVDKLIERLDTKTKQVLIEARLLETSMNPRTTKGMDWSGTLEAQHLAFGNNLQTGPVPQDSANPPLSTLWPKMMFDTARGFNPGTAFLDADGVAAVFSFLNKYAEAKVISAPRTVTLDNEPARIEVTRASPIINVTPGTANTTGGSQINYTNLGVILNVTPRISAKDQVNLKVVPEVSRVFDTVKKSLGIQGNYEADQYDIRKIETRVMIPSGNTLVLGGLVQDDLRQGNIKVPVLGDIPGLGLLFRSDSKSRQKSNLMVFITPTIVQDDDFQPTKSDFLKTPVPTQDSVEGDWSAWDSGKPKDWSKPKKDKTAAAKPAAQQKQVAEFSELPANSKPSNL